MTTPQIPPPNEQSETPFLNGLLDWSTTLPLAGKDHLVSLMADLLLELTGALFDYEPESQDDEQD